MATQIIRRRVDTDTYTDLASGDRNFVLTTAAEDVQPNDFFVFVEDLGTSTNREVQRKVSIVVEVEDTDILIAGLVPPEYQALDSIFANNNIVVAYGIVQLNGVAEISTEPAFLPPAAAPEINVHQANDFLGVAAWPDGQYSIMLKCCMTPVQYGQQDVTITESLIMCRTQRQHRDELLDLFLTVDRRFLLAGKIKDSFGNDVEAYFGEPNETDETGDYQDEDYETSVDGADPSATEE